MLNVLVLIVMAHAEKQPYNPPPQKLQNLKMRYKKRHV